MMELTWDQVRAWRLRQQGLLETGEQRDPSEAVSAVGQIQAQILSAAEHAVGARAWHCSRGTLRRAMWDDRVIVKTYGLRGTLHLIAADELPFWNAVMRSDAYWDDPTWQQGSGLTADRLGDLLAAIDDALRERCLTRDELATAVGSRLGGDFTARLSSTWGELLRPAAYLGFLCFGPNAGSKVTFVRPYDWLGHQQSVDSRTALPDAVRRYFGAYGPATRSDLGRWFGAPPKRARQLFDLVSDELTPVRIEGTRAWVLAPDNDPASWPSPDVFRGAPSVRLLGQYEAYVLGCGPKEQVLPDWARQRVFSVGRGRYEGAAANQILLVDGLVAGMWERSQARTGIEVLVECLTYLTGPQQRALASEAERLAAFYETDVTLLFGQVGVKKTR